ncbi:MAG: 50S ribosomal protein L32 [Candidatus Levybacteria bacterium]|nr:50S ribosomal protein L32 [Candidatus Levybacteria bacterium]
MPQEPKKRHSRQRQGKRRKSIKLGLTNRAVCENCHKIIKPHTVCKFCGYYNKKQIIIPKVKKEKKEKPE